MSALLGILGLVFYFIPSIYAHHAKKKNAEAITLLNLFLGWTVIGWVLALVWSATKESNAEPPQGPTGSPEKTPSNMRAWKWFAGFIVAIAAVSGIALQFQDHSLNPDAPPASKAAQSNRDIVSKWELSTEKSAMDGSPTVTLTLEAENRVSSWLDNRLPELYVRCLEHSTALILDGKVQYSVEGGDDLDLHSVRLRFDDSAPHAEQWSESSAGTALFSPSPLSEIRRLEKTKTLRVQYTPFNSNPAIATFDVSGLDAQIAPLRKACKW